MSEREEGSQAVAESCPGCGAVVTGGIEGCQRLFEDLMEREFSQPQLFGVHRLTVDCYSLQHPDRYMASRKSAAAHLAGICWGLEGDDGPGVSLALSRWLDSSPELSSLLPPPPRQRGLLTVRHVHEAPDSGAHVVRVGEWARTVWEAWAEHHSQAREWVREAERRTVRKSRG